MTYYMIHETYGLLDYNDHELIADKDSAYRLFNQLRERILSREKISEVYTDEEGELYVEADECAIKIYITEHTIQ